MLHAATREALLSVPLEAISKPLFRRPDCAKAAHGTVGRPASSRYGEAEAVFAPKGQGAVDGHLGGGAVVQTQPSAIVPGRAAGAVDGRRADLNHRYEVTAFTSLQRNTRQPLHHCARRLCTGAKLFTSIPSQMNAATRQGLWWIVRPCFHKTLQ